MKVILVTHPSSTDHATPVGHPERPARVPAAVAGVRRSGLEVVEALTTEVDRGLLLEIHDPEYVAAVDRFCASGGGALDADTYVVPGSWEAAMHSAGGGATAIDLLERGAGDTAFVATRPPGHHAERARAMGFCLFNNIAVAAALLRRQGHRVAVLDWDVHHGNGTESSFRSDPDLLYVSLHEFPAYPGSGWYEEVGSGDAAGSVVNLPMPTGSGGAEYRLGFERVVLPVLRQFGPDRVLVSAGYDAHTADPLAGLELREVDYRWMAASLAGIVPPRRVVFFLEGGYDLDAVTGSVAATLVGVRDGAEMPNPTDGEPLRAASRVVDLVVERHSEYWNLG